MSQAYEVSLHELLEKVPADARLVIEHADGYGTSYIPVGRYCKQAAIALRDQQATTLPKRELPVITDDEIMDQWVTVMKNTEGTALPILEFAHAITAKLENA
jgi:hypothetical protein